MEIQMTEHSDRQNNGDWAVTVERETAPKVLSRITSLAAPEIPEKCRIPRWVPGVGIAAVSLIAVICLSIANQRATREQAERAAQAYATVTAFLDHIETRKNEANSFMLELEGRSTELQRVTQANAMNARFTETIQNAITTVKRVEKAVLDTDTGGEQAIRELGALKERTDHTALADSVHRAAAEYRHTQTKIETKCQTVRSQIMSADRRIAKLKWDSKR